MRILLSEGASTSAREAITALGLRGHHVEVCDPDPHCLGRFSRFVRKFHRCPSLGADPQGYLAFIFDRISAGQFDVLLPIHEQGLLFAKVRARIARHVAVALPSFESYLRAHNKIGFSQILSELELPQPTTRVVASAEELMASKRFPMVLKTPVGTASRGIWIVNDDAELERAMAEIEAIDGFERIPDRPGCRAWRSPAVSGGVRGRPAARFARLSPDCARRRRRHLDQGEREPPHRPRTPRAHRRAPALARRARPSTTSSIGHRERRTISIAIRGWLSR